MHDNNMYGYFSFPNYFKPITISYSELVGFLQEQSRGYRY